MTRPAAGDDDSQPAEADECTDGGMIGAPEKTAYFSYVHAT